jgi:hypothetical protein
MKLRIFVSGLSAPDVQPALELSLKDFWEEQGSDVLICLDQCARGGGFLGDGHLIERMSAGIQRI